MEKREQSWRTAVSKLVSREEAADRFARLPAGTRTVFTNGCFDLLHRGHLELLQFARSRGDLLLVAVNSDSSVRRLKGETRPVQPEEDRALLIACMECVDLVVIFPEQTPLQLLRLLRPAVYVKGGDYRPADLPEAEPVRSWGGEVVLSPLLPGRSTSRLLSTGGDDDII